MQTQFSLRQPGRGRLSGPHTAAELAQPVAAAVCAVGHVLCQNLTRKPRRIYPCLKNGRPGWQIL
ncbi:unnamed protein product [Symbiodinium necroappetens]|uniref:Uncharacterized protein n=1 Tax=Symbiodinium necroappetens TaxID=1628268 RepID=A0A813AXW9_9DINO|nr:unnamed protein product [Symbiodinium necroappetens]